MTKKVESTAESAATEKAPDTKQVQAKQNNADATDKGAPVNATTKSTAEKLFPEWIEPEEKKEEKAESEDKKEEVSSESKPEPQSTLTVDDIREKTFTVKIGGVEKTVTGAELIKGYQLDQHLTRKGQEIAERERRLQESKPVVQPQQQAAVEVPEDQKFVHEAVKPLVDQFTQKITSLENVVQAIVESTRPSRYEATLKKIDKALKQDGHDDFMKYVPRIEEHLVGVDDSEFTALNNERGFRALYTEFKLRDTFKDRKSKGTDQIIEKVEREKAKVIPVVESGSGAPSGSDDDQASYDKEFENARKSGDFSRVLRLKGVI